MEQQVSGYRPHVEFFASTRENKRKSAERGRPVFDDVEKVRISIPGDPKTVHVAPANDYGQARDPNTNERLTYAQQFPEHYAAFKRNVEYLGDGTPLSEAPFLTEAKRQELKALKIHTVENLAALDGTNLSKLGMHARSLKDQAQAYLDKAAGSAVESKLAAENAELKDRMASMEAMIAEMRNTPAPVADSDTSEADFDAVAKEPTPFDDWDKDTIGAWYAEQGGKFDARWSIETARQKANDLNNELAKAKEAA